MDIGKVIRKYRKEAGLTQEEMANRLGVTTPAVNKWENGYSNPDIELLAPIARLLHISLETLMSFHEELAPSEVAEMVQELDSMLDSEDFEKVYARATEMIREYPNCNALIWQIAVILDARRLCDDSVDPERYDEQINSWYEMALQDENEEIRRCAADSLFGYYLRKKEYEKAEIYLRYFSDKDPMKKIHRGRLYEMKGEKESAYKAFEDVLFSEYQILNFAFIHMMNMAIEEKDFKRARYLAEKIGTIAGVFEMGKYHECMSMLDVVCAEKNIEGTCKVAEQLLENVDTLFDFRKSELYRHMQFKEVEPGFLERVKKDLMQGFRNDEAYSYMAENEAWKNFINGFRE